MINLFTIATHDQSIYYLNKIFGTMNGVLTPPGVVLATPSYQAGSATFAWNAPILDAGRSQVLGEMFRVFNSTILAVAALIVVYVTVVGVMASAHEGEFMGKKFDKLWMPLRMILGIVFLIPTATGYSTLQLIMMWVIVQGIGAADTLWTTAMNTLLLTNPNALMSNVSSPNAASEQQLTMLFQAVLCDQTAAKNAHEKIGWPLSYDGVNTYCYENPSTIYCLSHANWPNWVYPVTIPLLSDNSGAISNDAAPDQAMRYVFGPGGSCGILTYCNASATKGVKAGKTSDGKDTYSTPPGVCADPESMDCKSCKTQGLALHEIISLFRNYAQPVVDQDYNLMVVKYQEYTGGSPKPYFTDEMISYCGGKKDPLKDPKLSPEDCGYKEVPDPLYQKQSASANAVSYLYWTYVLQPMVTGNDDPNAPGDFIKASQVEYNKKFKDMQTDAKKPGGDTRTQLKGALGNAEQLGWIFAGAFYYNIAQVNNSNTKNSAQTFNISPPSTDENELNAMDSKGNPLYRSSYKAGEQLVKASQGHPESSPPGGEVVSAVGDSSGAFGGALISLTNTGDTNPLIQLQAVGYWLLFSAQIAFYYFTVATVVLGLLSGINAFFLGSGGINPMFVMSTMLYMVLVPLMYGILGIMITVGALLGVYVPLIPYIVFTMGALGWLMACIETMVAGPLVALGILSPGGHHEILGKAEAALMLLFQMFLRPSLMIFGLVAAMLLATVAVMMINTAFGMVLLTIMGQGFAGGGNDSASKVGIFAALINPLEAVFFLVAYVTITISALNKCFAAIHIIPERVFSWISGQGMQFGEGEALQESKGAVTGAASKAASGAEGVGKGAGQGAKEIGGEKKKEQQAKGTAPSEAPKVEPNKKEP